MNESDRKLILKMGVVISDVASGQGNPASLLALADDLLRLAHEIEWDMAKVLSEAGALPESDVRTQSASAILSAKEKVGNAAWWAQNHG